MVTTGVDGRTALAVLVDRVRGRELGGQDDLVTDPTLLHPLAQPALRLLVLVVVGRVDHVAAGVVEGVQELEGLLLAHRAHEAGPGIADGHGAELERRGAHAGGGGEDAVAPKLRLGLWCWFEERHDGCVGE